jgi:hypothetical protein
MPLKRIYLWRTEGEWEVLEAKIKELGKTSFSSYLRSEIPKLQAILNECPDCITPAKGERKEKIISITEESFNTIKEISEKMHTGMASVIDEFLITPLLLER